MAKVIYAGANGQAMKIKKLYAGANGQAMKAKKVYVGVNGVATLAWSGFTPKYAIPVLTGSKSALKGYAQVYSSETLDGTNYEISGNIAEVPCSYNMFTSTLTGFVSANGICALSVSELKNSDTNGVFYSTDCINWTFVPIVSGTGYLCYVNNEFLYIVGTTVYKSTDCIHWTNVGTISGLGNYANVKRIIYANDKGTMKYVCLVRYGSGGANKFFMGTSLVGTYTQYSPSSFNNALDIMEHPTDGSLWTMYTTTATSNPCYVENKTYYTSRYQLISNTYYSGGSGYGVVHGFMNDGTYMYALADIVVAKSTETKTGSMTMTELCRRASGGMRIDKRAYTDVVFEKEGNAYEPITKSSTPYYALRKFPYPYTTPTEIVFTSQAPTYGSGEKNLADRRATILLERS